MGNKINLNKNKKIKIKMKISFIYCLLILLVPIISFNETDEHQIMDLCSTCETKEEFLTPGNYYYRIKTNPNDELTITLKFSASQNISIEYSQYDHMPTDGEIISSIDYIIAYYSFSSGNNYQIEQMKLLTGFTTEYIVLKFYLSEGQYLRLGSSSSTASALGKTIFIICAPWIAVLIIIIIFKKCCCLCRRKPQTTSTDIINNYVKKPQYFPPIDEVKEPSVDSNTNTNSSSSDPKILPEEG